MISLEQIKREAEECLSVLKECKNVEDLRNLRHIGIEESDIQVSFNNRDFDTLASNCSPDSEFEACRIEMWPDTCLDFPTYEPKSKKFYFDVFDEDVDDMAAFLEDCTMDSIERDYNEYVTGASDEVNYDPIDNINGIDVYTCRYNIYKGTEDVNSLVSEGVAFRLNNWLKENDIADEDAIETYNNLSAAREGNRFDIHRNYPFGEDNIEISYLYTMNGTVWAVLYDSSKDKFIGEIEIYCI